MTAGKSHIDLYAARNTTRAVLGDDLLIEQDVKVA